MTAAADAGSHELLLDDAVRLAQRAATDDVAVVRYISPGVPHVYHAYHVILDEAGAAQDRAGESLSADLASAEHGVGDRQAYAAARVISAANGRDAAPAHPGSRRPAIMRGTSESGDPLVAA